MIDELLDHRFQLTSEFGASTLDKASGAYWCKGCKSEVPDSFLRTIAYVGYSDFDSLGRSAILLGKGLSERESPKCPKCETRGKLLHSDLFSYHEGNGLDLVARAIAPVGLFSRWKVKYFWWSPSQSFVGVKGLSEIHASEFAMSILVRRLEVESMVEEPEIEPLVAEGERFLEKLPGHQTLLSMIPSLIHWGRTGLAGAIAEAHTDLHPEDAAGHAWLGEILQVLVNRGVLPLEDLPDAVSALRRALELDPDHSRAKLMLATCYRIAGEDSQARSIYLELSSIDSESAMAHYNLGIMDLGVGDWLSALEHFRVGESLEPDDPDYPLGVARACIGLGRKSAAHEALGRAREISPEDPKLVEIESRIGEI